ncbi:hypothetical protein F5B21DRAFT_504350 [Xylaria acuta]|nr:hypothetical protein F5B21DRAFT_504350 [Xylaria acuta]
MHERITKVKTLTVTIIERDRATGQGREAAIANVGGVTADHIRVVEILLDDRMSTEETIINNWLFFLLHHHRRRRRHQCPQMQCPYRLIRMIYSAKNVRNITAIPAFAATTGKTSCNFVSAAGEQAISSRIASLVIHDDHRAFYLYDCRQGLGLVATTSDCSHILATPGFHVRGVLTTEQTREISNNPRRSLFDCTIKHLNYTQFGTIQEEA